MIGISKVTLNVADQDAAKRFWVDTLGFSVVTDQPMDDQGRWIEVRSPEDRVTLVLYPGKKQDTGEGRLSDILFECDDIEQAYAELSTRGVQFGDKPVKQPWGWWASFKDNEGTLYGLGQRGD
jgi:catechol 2,3-dioxygenase-like lactoylglutathione lyase family enzyme